LLSAAPVPKPAEEGVYRHPETFSKMFTKAVARCGQALGEDAVPAIRLHDLRHTHATLLLADREPVSNVSQRLGHASEVITLTIYSHVLPGDQKRAAARFATLVAEG
jgi:integrase